MLDAVLLSLALAMDATAVALTRGLGGNRTEGLAIVVLFGSAQAAMASVGLLLSDIGRSLVEGWYLWAASALLIILGVRMVWNAWNTWHVWAARQTVAAATDVQNATSERVAGSISWWSLAMLAIATSIDAAVAGTTLRLLDVSAAVAIAAIGLITALCCGLGFVAGSRLRGTADHQRTLLFELVGGLVLIGLAIKTALQAN